MKRVQTEKMETLQVYKLGEGCPRTPEGKPIHGYESVLYYAPSRKESPFYLASGGAHYGNGTFLTASELLQPQWQSDLHIVSGEWLLPLVERLAQGEILAASEVLELHKQHHGTLPEQSEWTLR